MAFAPGETASGPMAIAMATAVDDAAAAVSLPTAQSPASPPPPATVKAYHQHLSQHLSSVIRSLTAGTQVSSAGLSNRRKSTKPGLPPTITLAANGRQGSDTTVVTTTSVGDIATDTDTRSSPGESSTKASETSGLTGDSVTRPSRQGSSNQASTLVDDDDEDKLPKEELMAVGDVPLDLEMDVAATPAVRERYSVPPLSPGLMTARPHLVPKLSAVLVPQASARGTAADAGPSSPSSARTPSYHHPASLMTSRRSSRATPGLSPHPSSPLDTFTVARERKLSGASTHSGAATAGRSHKRSAGGRTPRTPRTHHTPRTPRTPRTREDEHRAAWEAAGRKVWKSLPKPFNLSLSGIQNRKSRRGSNKTKHSGVTTSAASGTSLSSRPSRDHGAERHSEPIPEETSSEGVSVPMAKSATGPSGARGLGIDMSQSLAERMGLRVLASSGAGGPAGSMSVSLPSSRPATPPATALRDFDRLRIADGSSSSAQAHAQQVTVSLPASPARGVTRSADRARHGTSSLTRPSFDDPSRSQVSDRSSASVGTSRRAHDSNVAYTNTTAESSSGHATGMKIKLFFTGGFPAPSRSSTQEDHTPLISSRSASFRPAVSKPTQAPPVTGHRHAHKPAKPAQAPLRNPLLSPEPAREQDAEAALVDARAAKKAARLAKTVERWRQGVSQEWPDTIMTPPEIDPYIPSPSIVSSSRLRLSPFIPVSQDGPLGDIHGARPRASSANLLTAPQADLLSPSASASGSAVSLPAPRAQVAVGPTTVPMAISREMAQSPSAASATASDLGSSSAGQAVFSPSGRRLGLPGYMPHVSVPQLDHPRALAVAEITRIEQAGLLSLSPPHRVLSPPSYALGQQSHRTASPGSTQRTPPLAPTASTATLAASAAGPCVKVIVSESARPRSSTDSKAALEREFERRLKALNAMSAGVVVDQSSSTTGSAGESGRTPSSSPANLASHGATVHAPHGLMKPPTVIIRGKLSTPHLGPVHRSETPSRDSEACIPGVAQGGEKDTSPKRASWSAGGATKRSLPSDERVRQFVQQQQQQQQHQHTGAGVTDDSRTPPSTRRSSEGTGVSRTSFDGALPEGRESVPESNGTGASGGTGSGSGSGSGTDGTTPRPGHPAPALFSF